MEPSSDAEILPSPLTSNFLKTSSSSPARRVRERTEREVDREGGSEDEDGLLNIDFKPMGMTCFFFFFFFVMNERMRNWNLKEE